MDTLKAVLHSILDLLHWPPTVNEEQRQLLHDQIEQIAEEIVGDVIKQISAGDSK